MLWDYSRTFNHTDFYISCPDLYLEWLCHYWAAAAKSRETRVSLLPMMCLELTPVYLEEADDLPETSDEDDPQYSAFVQSVNHTTLKAIHIYNTYLALILPYIAFRIPFTVFLMRSYFLSIPKELEEAAIVDGYNSFQIFMKIIVPISKPVFSACGIVSLNHVWNEFLFANVFLESKKLMTIPIGLMTFKGDLRADYTGMLAGILLASMPLIILFLCMSRQFIRGLTAGAVKG